MKEAGSLACGLGAILLVIALVLPTSVDSGSYLAPDEILNLGLLQRQMMCWQAGLAFIIGGIVLIGSGNIVQHLSGEVSANVQSATQTSSIGRTCEWCDLVVHEPNRACSDFPADKLASMASQIKAPTCIKALNEQGIEL